MKYIATEYYEKKFSKLDGSKMQAINKRLFRIEKFKKIEDFGDYKQLANNLYEMRIFECGGIRIYFTIQNEKIVLLINVGFKESKAEQDKDIEIAKDLLNLLTNKGK